MNDTLDKKASPAKEKSDTTLPILEFTAADFLTPEPPCIIQDLDIRKLIADLSATGPE